MIAKIRFQIHDDGGYCERKIQFPVGADIVETAEMIEAFCRGYQLGSGFSAHLIALHDVERFDFKFDNKPEIETTRDRFLECAIRK